ncbi:MAG TPA: hypothetical protein VLS45_01245, partial [Methylomicrobium sp.]|nr:hypothetical protein [Methylomicrobium sp.]
MRRGSKAGKKRGPEGDPHKAHIGISVNQKTKEKDSKGSKEHGIEAVKINEVRKGPWAMKYGAFDFNLGRIDGAGKLIHRPIVVNIRFFDVLFIELLESKDIEIIALFYVDRTPMGCLKHAIQPLEIFL